MWLEYIFLFLLGLSVGSFLTVVAERFDSTESFWKGRSHCNKCQHILSWWELIPLIGYLLLHGRCRYCRGIIPKSYIYFELLTGLVFIGLRFAQATPNYWVLTGQLIIASLLIILLIYDWLHQMFPTLLLHLTSAATFVITLTLAYLFPASMNHYQVADPLFLWLNSPDLMWLEKVKGAIVGATVLGLLAFPSKGRWMGYGDVWLAFILGLWVGYPMIIFGLMAAFYLGAAVAIGQIATRKVAQDHRIAFGPFLIIGSFLVVIWGRQLFTAIISLWQIS